MALELVIANKRISSWSMRPWLVLSASGLPFTERLVRYLHPSWTAEVGSPSGKVPLLRDGALAIHESLAICEYVAELAPQAGLWPADRAARAVARAVSSEMHAGFPALRSECSNDLLRRERNWPLSDKARLEVARVEELWRDCRARFGAGGPYLFGATFGIADAMFAPIVGRFGSYGVEVGAEAQAYVETIWSNDHVRRWVAGAEAERDWEVGDRAIRLAGASPS